MARKRHTVEEIVAKLRQVGALFLSEGISSKMETPLPKW
jgi:hypothetical protein